MAKHAKRKRDRRATLQFGINVTRAPVTRKVTRKLYMYMSCQSRCLHSPRLGAGRLGAVLITSLPQSAERQIWMSTAPPWAHTGAVRGYKKAPPKYLPRLRLPPFNHNVQRFYHGTMSSAPNRTFTPSNFEALFDAALAKYTKRPGQDLHNHESRNSQECSIDASLRIRSSLHSKRNPRHLMNSGMVIQS